MEIRYTPLERKVAIIRLGVTYRTISKRCKCKESVVANVIGGRRATWEGQAAKVRREVARLLGLPVEVVFPEYAEHIAKKAAA